VTWTIALHGGATDIEPHEEEDYRAGCLRALEAGRVVLEGGGCAVEAVVAAIGVLEDDPTFNAGTGSAHREDGSVEMDAALMDGRSLEVGAITVIQHVRNPIGVALALMGEETCLLAGAGAESFARERGLGKRSVPPLRLAGERKRVHKHDTVGCVARDQSGRLAAGTSTGGLDGALAGRVGDSPLPGCGFYADDEMGAVVLSGDGEAILRAMAAARILHDLPSVGPDGAIGRALRKIAALGGEAGAVLISPDGRIARDHNSREFCVASQREGEEPMVTIRKTRD
jgi:beta-aspartyl-peptidase (threonine type)